MHESRPRSPGVAFTALTLALVVLLGVFALTSRQPPPPTIAEFAPQAIENITDSPEDQSSNSGRNGGAGGLGGGSETPSPDPALAPIEAPRVRKCVGDPPRQIEDPQSPPCVPYWVGDNGGATARGVTANQIIVAAPGWDGSENALYKMTQFFNKRFEFYGRRITLKGIETPDDKPEVQRSVAGDVDEKLQAFASIRWDASAFDYYDELARRKVIATSVYAELPEATMASLHPFMWQYPMGIDRQFAQVGTWGCKRLAGQNATHSGNPGDNLKQRVFGVISQTQKKYSPVDTSPLTDALSACGHPSKVTPARFDEDAAAAENAVLQMRDAGVTSVFCMCHVFGGGYVTKAATNQGYFPEWLVTTYNLFDYNQTIHAFISPDQRAHLFGITFIPRIVAPVNNPSRWAEQEIDPGAVQTEDDYIELTRSYQYQNLLVLASGIQMAGPRLTPEMFSAGLHKAKFPNPPHPNMPGAVGFEDRDHGMTNDAAEFYWSESGKSPFRDEQFGAICYVEGGRRYARGQFPRGGDPFFQGTCDSGAQ